MDAIESSGTLAGDTPAVGLWEWFRGVLLKLLGTQAAPTPHAETMPVEEVDEEGTYVAAPGGYRIRIPGDVGHSVGEMLPSVREALASVPPLPHVVVELIREVQSSTSTAASVAEIAATDPALAASLLRTVNSAAFGLSRKITSVTDAVNYLGFAMVRSIVVRLRLDQVLPRGTPEAAADAQDLWVHSLAVSYVADCLAERVPGVDRGLASTLGLLHDIGKLAILARLGGVGSTASGDESGEAREAAAFGVDHAGLGAAFAHRWGLPADLVQSIRWHHHPEKAFEATDPPGLRKAVLLVRVANQLAKYAYPYADRMELDAGADAARAALSLGTSAAELMDEKVRAAVTRAVLFAAENAEPGSPRPARFIRLRAGEEAAALAAGDRAPCRVKVDEGKVLALFDAAGEAVDVESAKGRSAAIEALASKPAARLSSSTTREGIDRLTAAALTHQRALPLDAASRGPAAFTVRVLLANLVDPDAGDTRAEVVQSCVDGKLTWAVRARRLSFDRRLGTAADGGPRLVEAELAAVLNLGWFQRVTLTPDGSAWLLEGR